MDGEDGNRKGGVKREPRKENIIELSVVVVVNAGESWGRSIIIERAGTYVKTRCSLVEWIISHRVAVHIASEIKGKKKEKKKGSGWDDIWEEGKARKNAP